MSVEKWADFSSYQGDWTRAKIKRLKNMGFKGVIVQLWGGTPNGVGPNVFAEKALRYARDIGLSRAGYTWLPPDDEIETGSLAEATMNAAGKEGAFLDWFSIDIEGKQLHPTDPVKRLDNFFATMGQLLPIREYDIGGKLTIPIVLYLRVNNIEELFDGATLSFTGIPIWEARYLKPSGVNPGEVEPLLLKEWKFDELASYSVNERFGLQYAGSVALDNEITVDLNLIDMDVLKRLREDEEKYINEHELEDDMTGNVEKLEDDTHVSVDIDDIQGSINRMIDEAQKKVNEMIDAAQVVANATVDAMQEKVSWLTETLTELKERVDKTIPPRTSSAARERIYVVKEGDTLSIIARNMLGQSGRYIEIGTLNGMQHPYLIHPGQELKLPLQ